MFIINLLTYETDIGWKETRFPHKIIFDGSSFFFFWNHYLAKCSAVLWKTNQKESHVGSDTRLIPLQNGANQPSIRLSVCHFDFTSTLHSKKSVQSGYERRAKRYKRSTFFLERTRKDHRQLHQRWNRFKGSAGGKLTEGMGRISDKRRVNGSNYKAGCFFACLFLFFIEVCGSKRSAGCFEWQEKSQ